ncbi:MAG: lipoyl protein ligase domain-containing protein, partial [Candidatus Limnocylindrales bacterium]
RDGHPGCWCDPDGANPRKIGALGLRIERGVSYHGIALNVTVDLADFALIDPCGMPGVESTSIARERGEPKAPPSTSSVERAAWIFARAFAAAIDAPLATAATDPTDPTDPANASEA